jgi:hypothetical protein
MITSDIDHGLIFLHAFHLVEYYYHTSNEIFKFRRVIM